MKATSVMTSVLLCTMLTACGLDSIPAASSTTVTSPTTATTVATATTVTTATTTTTASADSTAPVSGCAAAGLPATPVGQDVPAQVAEVRDAIVAAAVACDFVGLADLAADEFTYSFGDGGDPAAYWSGLESDSATTGTVSPLAMLVRVLGLPFGTVDDGDAGTIYVWPSAYAYDTWDDVPQSDRDALLDLHGAQGLADFEAFGAYIGYRVGITDTGEWIFFVAGD